MAKSIVGCLRTRKPFPVSINMCIFNRMNPLSAFNNILCLQLTSPTATARTRSNMVQQKLSFLTDFAHGDFLFLTHPTITFVNKFCHSLRENGSIPGFDRTVAFSEYISM